MNLLDRATRNLFFTGKGGVGKTSTACAVAASLADRGRRVLLVSTDPASNVDEVLESRLGTQPTSIAAVPRLHAMNVDPEAAARDYRERVVGPYRGLLPESAIASIEEQLAGACTVEIAAFDEFAKLLGNQAVTGAYDHVVFDTAPTGHTLRLLSLPAAWTGFIESNTAGTSCLGPLQGLLDQRAIYAGAVAALADGERTTLVLVSRPEATSLAEAARTGAELAELGLRNQVLVLNGVYEPVDRSDPVAEAMGRRAREALLAIPQRLAELPRQTIALRAEQVIGVEALRRFLQAPGSTSTAPARSIPEPAQASPVARSPSRASTGPTAGVDGARVSLPGIDALVDTLASRGKGLIMTMGKGGVGKTTIAAHVAVELARRGHRVHLTTTDPAAHVAQAVGELPQGLSVGEIDPRVEVARYREEVMSTTGARLDDAGRALLEEDLRSPCTEELAVFQAFARAVAEANDRFVVIDTAPTGHTLLLLDAAQAYHREVMRQAKSVPGPVVDLLPRLRDPEFTSIILCTLAEATPVHEAAALQADLRRAGIEPRAWLINQSLAPLSVRDPVLAGRRAQEARYIDEVLTSHARDAYVVPWRVDTMAAPGKLPGRQRAAVAQ